jgi:hypothetical protein
MRAVLAMIVLVGCSKSSSDGLPPATDWSGDPNAATPSMPNRPRGAPSDDPHAQMMQEDDGEGQADPHAGVPGAPPLSADDMRGAPRKNPHEGVPGAPPLTDDQIAGGAPNAGGGDVSKLGLQSPDPDRPIDPNKHVKGMVRVKGALKDKVTEGMTVFFMVRKAGADGQPTGAPIAVERAEWHGDSITFELGERQAMIQGAPDLVGDVVVMARLDHDQDAMTKQPGDITGMVKAKIPADNLVLELDTVLP